MSFYLNNWELKSLLILQLEYLSTVFIKLVDNSYNMIIGLHFQNVKIIITLMKSYKYTS